MIRKPRSVLRVADVDLSSIRTLLARYGLSLVIQNDDAVISGSFWGDAEAGIIGRRVFVRTDTPIHSLLHEAGHIICMPENRRKGLSRDAGGGDLEEAAVCYLQILLADQIDGVGRLRLMQDMDTWGYSFRLGNTTTWFRGDAEDAIEFLQNHGLLDGGGELTFRLRR